MGKIIDYRADNPSTAVCVVWAVNHHLRWDLGHPGSKQSPLPETTAGAVSPLNASAPVYWQQTGCITIIAVREKPRLWRAGFNLYRIDVMGSGSAYALSRMGYVRTGVAPNIDKLRHSHWRLDKMAWHRAALPLQTVEMKASPYRYSAFVDKLLEQTVRLLGFQLKIGADGAG